MSEQEGPSHEDKTRSSEAIEAEAAGIPAKPRLLLSEQQQQQQQQQQQKQQQQQQQQQQRQEQQQEKVFRSMTSLSPQELVAMHDMQDPRACVGFGRKGGGRWVWV